GDGAEPAHHRALIRPDHIEARGKVRAEQDQHGDCKPGTCAALARAGQIAAASLRLGWRLVADAVPVAGQRHLSSSSDFFFRSRSASAAETAPRSCGGPAAPTGADAPGAGSPAGGCASKRNARRTSASAGRNSIVLSSRTLSYACSVRRKW